MIYMTKVGLTFCGSDEKLMKIDSCFSFFGRSDPFFPFLEVDIPFWQLKPRLAIDRLIWKELPNLEGVDELRSVALLEKSCLIRKELLSWEGVA